MAGDHSNGFKKFEELNRARNNLHLGYKTLGKLVGRQLKGDTKFNKRDINDVIDENIYSINKARVDLSFYTNEMIYEGIKNPDISKSALKNYENEFRKTMDTYKEVAELCNKYKNYLTDLKNDIGKRCKNPYFLPPETYNKIYEMSAWIDRFQNDSKQYSDKISDVKDRYDETNMRLKAYNESQPSVYYSIIKMKDCRERILFEVDKLFELERKSLENTNISSGSSTVIDLLNKKTELLNECTDILDNTKVIINNGIQKTDINSKEFEVFCSEAQKTIDMCKKVGDRFEKNINDNKILYDSDNLQTTLLNSYNIPEIGTAFKNLHNQLNVEKIITVYGNKANINSKHINSVLSSIKGMSDFRENITKEVDKLFKFEEEKLKNTHRSDVGVMDNKDLPLFDQHAKALEACQNINENTLTLIYEGLSNTAYKTKEFDMLCKEAQKTIEVCNKIGDRFGERAAAVDITIGNYINRFGYDSQDHRLKLMEDYKNNSLKLSNAFHNSHNNLNVKLYTVVNQKKAEKKLEQKKNNRSNSTHGMRL